MFMRRTCLLVLAFVLPNLGYAGIARLAPKANDSWSSSGLLGAQVISIATDPSNPNVILAGIKTHGVYRSDNAGLSWTPVITSPVDGLALAFAPSDNAFVAAATAGGLFLSHDHGQSWVKRLDTLAGHLDCVAQVAISPVDPDVVLASGYDIGFAPCGEGATDNGLYRSQDGGNNFELVCCAGAGFGKIAFAPSAPHIVYAASASDVLRSEDSGQTWQTIDGNFVGTPNPTSLAVDPANAETVYRG